MIGPLDAVTAFHNAFRQDMRKIDAIALELARGRPDVRPELDRYRFFSEILAWHAHGEELSVFPALDRVAPLFVQAYVEDHRGLDTLSTELASAAATGDVLATARATAAFKFHLDIHLLKEDTYLYPLVRERVAEADLIEIGRALSASVPKERYPEAIGWLFALLGPQDRENLVRVWQTLLPPPVFAGVVQLVRRTIGDEWAELVKRIPSLA